MVLQKSISLKKCLSNYFLYVLALIIGTKEIVLDKDPQQV
jgi:hypothetical protein